MSSNCPPAPVTADLALDLSTTSLEKGQELIRFFRSGYPPDTFNRNAHRRMDLPEHGSRFNPFPDAAGVNVPTLYAADALDSAALESVFHDVEHVPAPTFAKMRLADWSYSRLVVQRPLTVFKLTNQHLRQIAVSGRKHSLQEDEVVHCPPNGYPLTRAWARFLYASLPTLDGLAWRARLGGSGLAYVFFGSRCREDAIKAEEPSISLQTPDGFRAIKQVAEDAKITIIG